MPEQIQRAFRKTPQEDALCAVRLVTNIKTECSGGRGTVRRLSVLTSGYLCGKAASILMKKLGAVSR